MKNQERIEAIIAKYPRLFPNGRPRCGFEVSNGWLSLIENLCSICVHHLEHAKNLVEDPDYPIQIAQIKEKFGTLRCYWDGSTSYINGATNLAEQMSGTICEDCGNPGTTSGTGAAEGWLRTLCETCREDKK